MTLLLFVIMEMVPPVLESSVHTRHLSGVRNGSTCRWQAECHPQVCIPTGPLMGFSTCIFPQYVSVVPTLCDVFGLCHHLRENKASLVLGTASLTVWSCRCTE